MTLRKKTLSKKTYAQKMNTRFFRIVDGSYFQEVSFEELEKRYFECKKEIDEAEKNG